MDIYIGIVAVSELTGLSSALSIEAHLFIHPFFSVSLAHDFAESLFDFDALVTAQVRFSEIGLGEQPVDDLSSALRKWQTHLIFSHSHRPL